MSDRNLVQPMRIDLPLAQWQVVIQLLRAAPFEVSKDILAAIHGQARELDEKAARERAELSQRAYKLEDELKKMQADARNSEYLVSQLQRMASDLKRKNASLTERLQEQRAPKPRKARKARKARNGAVKAGDQEVSP